jgi:chromosome segregation ATPase
MKKYEELEEAIDKAKEQLKVHNREMDIRARLIKQMSDELKKEEEKKEEISKTIDDLKLQLQQNKIDRDTYKHVTWSVTDHVRNRYLERVLQLDMDHINDSILTEGIKAQVRILGDGQYEMEGEQFKGFLLTVKNRSAITLWHKDEKKRK